MRTLFHPLYTLPPAARMYQNVSPTIKTTMRMANKKNMVIDHIGGD